MRRGRLLALAVVAVVVVAGAYVGLTLLSHPHGGSPSTLAPSFTLPDIYGHPFNLSAYRSSDVVLIEFTALSCSYCQIVEKDLASLYAGYNASGATKVAVLSVYIEPGFGDTIPALQAYHNRNNITWAMAQDTPSLAVSQSYGVTDIPDVFVVDKAGHVVYDKTGVQITTDGIGTTVSSALKGTAPAIAIVTVSVFALAAIAGVSTFFSPCAFPMFPGYMSLYLGLNASRASAATQSPGTYGGAARRAVLAGGVTALGMVLVFLALGAILVLATSAVSRYIPSLLVVVGVVLVGLGALLLTNLQYWRVVSPFQKLWARLRRAPPVGTPSAENPKGLYVKLFGYGLGYAAAAAGCVAPVILSAIVAGLALGLVGGIVTVLIYSVTAALLMVVVTVLIALASRRFINQLKAATPIIKKVSAVALILVGVYLVYFYYTAWVA